MISRILSAVIAIAYVTVAYFAGGAEAALKFGVFLILTLRDRRTVIKCADKGPLLFG
jgi:hypothetical protein